MNFQEFENYIQGLCASHIDLRDGVDGRRSYMRLFSDDELNSIANIPSKYIVITENITASTTGTPDENKYAQQWTLSFLGKAEVISSDPTMSRDNVIEKAWHIMMQFIAKMWIDWNDGCGPLKGLSAKMNWRIVQDMQLEHHYGWELQLTQIITAPAYDPSKWV